jgi:hypothetical protein
MPAQRTQMTAENFIGTPRELEYNTIYRRANSCPPESRFGKVKIEGPPSHVSRYEPYDKRTFTLLKMHDQNMLRRTDTIEKKLNHHATATSGNIKAIRRKLEKLEEIKSKQTDLINLNAQLFGEMEMNTFNIQDIMGSIQALVMKVNRIENGVRDLRELVEEDYRSEDHPDEEDAEQDLPRYVGNRADEGSDEEGTEAESSNGLTLSELGRYMEESRYYDFPVPTLETLLADRAGRSSPVAGPSRLPLADLPIPDTLVEITEDLQPVFRVFKEEDGEESENSYHTPMIKPEVIDLTHIDDEDEERPYRCTVPSER